MVGEFKKKNLSKSVGSSVFCLDCKALENLEIATDIRFLENLKIATGFRFHQGFHSSHKIITIHHVGVFRIDCRNDPCPEVDWSASNGPDWAGQPRRPCPPSSCGCSPPCSAWKRKYPKRLTTNMTKSITLKRTPCWSHQSRTLLREVRWAVPPPAPHLPILSFTWLSGWLLLHLLCQCHFQPQLQRSHRRRQGCRDSIQTPASIAQSPLYKALKMIERRFVS